MSYIACPSLEGYSLSAGLIVLGFPLAAVVLADSNEPLKIAGIHALTALEKNKALATIVATAVRDGINRIQAAGREANTAAEAVQAPHHEPVGAEDFIDTGIGLTAVLFWVMASVLAWSLFF